jgi:MerR family redox-sensitive transcriptional activator SoxR
MGDMSIGEVARRAGVRTSAIRYYESEGLIPRAGRRSGRRVYDPGIFDHLTFVRLALGAGFHVSEIKNIVRGLTSASPPGERWRAVAGGKLLELNRQIDALQSKKQLLEQLVKCRCPSLAHFVAMTQRR